MTAVLPLQGCRVVITRAAHQGETLFRAFATAGAEVVALPLLQVSPAPAEVIDAASAAARAADWLVFASANAVASLDGAVELIPSIDDGGPHIAVVGQATAAAVRERDLEPHLVATRSRASGLVAELAPQLRPGSRVVVPQADDARPELVRGLTAAGAQVASFVTYHKALPSDAGTRSRSLFAEGPLGWVTFTSPRIVRHFVQALEDGWPRRRHELLAVSIGPVTSAELRRQDVEPVEACEPTPEAMVRAVIERHESAVSPSD